MSPRIGSLITGLALVMASFSASAAEVTDVLDAFDSAHNNPYDLSLRVRFSQQSRSAQIAREYRCISNDHVGAESCPNGSQTLLSRELDYSRNRRVLNIDARVGVHHDVELYGSVPIVLSDSWSHRYIAGVSAANSRVRANTDTSAIMGVPYESNERSGLGDVKVGLKWSPYNYYRDTAHPTWVMGIEYTLPTGTPMEASNNAVGLGLHELHLFTTISRRALGVLEPFFNLHSRLRFESDNSLFRKTRQAATQVRVTPGNVIGTNFGLEIIPWEDLKKDTRIEIEFGFSMDYIFRGREYTEVWEALASPNNPCQQSSGCSLTSHTKSDLDPATGQHAVTNGITDVEQYGRFTGWASLHYQPVKAFQLSASFNYAVDSPHFITFGDYGRDLDGQDGVRQANTKARNEYSPVFLPALDAPGGRLRLQQAATWTFMLALNGKL